MKSIQLVLDLGGNVTTTDGRGHRPPIHALVIGEEGDKTLLLYILPRIMQKLGAMNALIEYGADPHATGTELWTALHFAIISGSQAVDILIPYYLHTISIENIP